MRIADWFCLACKKASCIVHVFLDRYQYATSSLNLFGVYLVPNNRFQSCRFLIFRLKETKGGRHLNLESIICLGGTL